MLLGTHAAEWFNADANYAQAVGVPLMVKRALAQPKEAPMLRLLGASAAARPPDVPTLEVTDTPSPSSFTPAPMGAAQAVRPWPLPIVTPRPHHRRCCRLLLCSCCIA